jgi:hypothetical protein
MCKNSVKKRVSELLMREKKERDEMEEKLTNWLWQKNEERRRKTSKAKCRQEIHLQVMKL